MVIVTHDGGFHSDEVFATATLLLISPDSRIVRSRKPEDWEKGDYVVDVGGVYDEEKNRFDHHQVEGAGERENGIPYSSFGLVWKKFGKQVSQSDEVFEYIDKELAQPIDAHDCGIKIVRSEKGLSEYTIGKVIHTFMPLDESADTNEAFQKAVMFAQKILCAEIDAKKYEIGARAKIKEAYEQSEDKRILVLEERIPWEKEVIEAHQDVLFVVYPHTSQWRVKTVKKNLLTFEPRKALPKEWGGKIKDDLASVTGVSDAVFCHRALFTAGAGSKEGALALAKLAVDNFLEG
ncbi:metal-dependent hydrolase [bacterium]|nr:metal-dependent hydrolase [bacterium]|tara:strand:+ start:1235 stop:2110 length:876 start_codon:yes stop_codon:yes gene_type:complete